MKEVEIYDHEVWPQTESGCAMIIRPSQNHPELQDGDIFRAEFRWWGNLGNVRPMVFRVEKTYTSLLQRVLPFEVIKTWNEEWVETLYVANPLVWVAETRKVEV